MGILTRFAAGSSFRSRISKSHAAPSVATITTHYGQFAARRGKVADRPAGAGCASPSRHRLDPCDICGGAAARYYLSAIFAFAREARPCRRSMHCRASPTAPRRRPASQPSLRPRHDRFRVGDGRRPTSNGAPARVARAVRYETQGETAVFGACDVCRCRARQIRQSPAAAAGLSHSAACGDVYFAEATLPNWLSKGL